MVPIGPFVMPAQAATCSPTTSGFTGNGSIGVSGTSYTVLTFSTAGNCDWTVPAGVTSIEALVVAGGGGGGGRNWAGGGGGGGVLRNADVALTPGSPVSVSVGAGGIGGANAGGSSSLGANGGPSSFGSVSAPGGGGGGGVGWNDPSFSGAGNSGGSGGGVGEHGDDTAASGTLLYRVTNPKRSSSAQIVYDTDGRSSFGSAGINRITYRMQVTVAGTPRWAEATFDPWKPDMTAQDLRVPDLASGNQFEVQEVVSNMIIDSNMTATAGSLGVTTSGVEGTQFSGYLELWPWNYETALTLGNDLSGDPRPAGDGSLFDVNDSPTDDEGYGSFQVHNVSPGSEETVLAWNLHFTNTPAEIGLGTRSTLHPDWTFSSSGSTTQSLGQSGWSLDILANKNPFQALLGGLSTASAPSGWSAHGNSGGSVGVVASQAGSGGGGAGSVGVPVPRTSNQTIDGVYRNRIAGGGGAGLASDIAGSSIFYAGGGGGGTHDGAGDVRGLGGTGGGGAGAFGSTEASAGNANTGGGGGGAGSVQVAGAAGGSGVVVLRFVTPVTLSYDANASQHQRGVTTGAVPASSAHAHSSRPTVSANSGSLARQGFTFAGWNTQANGLGTNYAAGSGSFAISANTTLYAKWEIPKAARLIGLTGADAVGVVTVTGEPTGTGGGIRGITTDGYSVYFLPSNRSGYVRNVGFDGTFIADHQVPGLTSAEQRDLTYSNGCIFVRGADVATLNTLNCIDTSTWRMNSVTVPTPGLETGQFWLTGNLIDFPDGRVGAVSANNQSMTVGTGAGQCPSGMHCKRLRLYIPTGSGASLTLAFSEDIVLADTDSNWPDDDHGIATDGTYLYQSRHLFGYKVWALQSGQPSYLVFNGDGSGTCSADTGVSGTQCPIAHGLFNATFFARDHLGKRYLVGDYNTGAGGTANKFYMTVGSAPPAGPGTPAVPAAPTAVTAVAGSGSAAVSWSAPSDVGGAALSSFTATASPGGAGCTTALGTNLTCTVTGLANGTAYTFTVVATNAGGNSPASAASASVTPAGSQSISFPAPTGKSYGDSAFAPATASSALTVSLSSSTTSVCTVSGVNVTILIPGTCTITAAQVGNGSYDAATEVTRTFEVSKKALTMSVAIADRPYDGTSVARVSGTPTLTGVVAGDSAYVAVDTTKITAAFAEPSAGSGLAVAVTLASGVLKPGSSGDRSDRYTVTLLATPTATISKANQSALSMTSSSTVVFGNTVNLVATGGSHSGAITFSVASGTCTVSGGTLTVGDAGSVCTVSATRSSNANFNAVTSSSVTITVAQVIQTLNFTSSVPVSAVAGTTYTPAATSTSGLSVTLAITSGSPGVCGMVGAVVTFVTSGTCVITASQAGTTNVAAGVSVTQTIVAGKINQTLSFPAIAGKDFGDPAFLAGASVSSARAVAYVTSTVSVCAVNSSSGLVSITAVGTCTITVSSLGNSSYAAASEVTRSFVVSPVVAGKPSITSVSFGDSAVTVAFTAPSFVGGAAVAGYEVVATSSGGVVTKPDCGTSTPCTITGLTNGSSYTVTIAALNAAGVGPSSTVSPAITPAGIPHAVSGLATAPGNGQLVVSWAPVDTAGLAGGTFTRYDISIRVRGDSWSSALTPDGTNNLGTQATSSYTFTGLVNGTSYDVQIVAITTANSTALSSNTATALGVPSTVPDAPTALTVASTSTTSAVASWSAPVDDGGAAITAYAVNIACTFVSATDTFCTISGLAAGSLVTVSVGATNLMGTGSAMVVSITMPRGSSGSGGGSSGSSGGSSGVTPGATSPPALLSPVTPRIIVSPRPTLNPSVLSGPVVSPGRGFDPAAGTRASIGGAPATVTKRPVDNGGFSIQAGAFQLGMTLSSPQPQGSPGFTAGGTDFRVPTGQSTRVSGGGLLPGSQLQVWLPGSTGKTPIELARVSVRADGTFASELAFSANRSEAPLPIGPQVMQMTGYDAQGNQIVVDTTVNVAQGSPAPELNRSVNALPRLGEGESLATSGGVPETVRIEVRQDACEVATIAGEWQITLTVPEASGRVSEVGSRATITLIQSQSAAVSGEGFQPDTRADLWLFSDPTLFGSVTVGADGAFTGEFYVDARFVLVGEHTLQVQGVGRDGLVKAANLGVAVETPVSLSVNRASWLLWWALAALGVVALLVTIAAIVRRRRSKRRDRGGSSLGDRGTASTRPLSLQRL